MKKNYIKFIKQIKKNNLLMLSIGCVYLFFGILKFFSSLSPAEDIAIQTINRLTLNLIPSNISLTLLAVWETVIGILLIVNKLNKTILFLALAHIILTFTPLLLIPEATFSSTTHTPTLLGQYIFKNIIIVAALLTQLQNKKITYAKS